MKRVNFLRSVVLGVSALVFSLFVLTNCEQRRDGARDTQTTANIESERQELARELQTEINQLERMITDYETRKEDENLPKESKDNFNKMASDLGDARDDLKSELNSVQNANADNWHEKRAEARQTLAEVSAEVEQITAGRDRDDINMERNTDTNRETNRTF
jgi:type II secretory pathway component PulJ